MTNLEILAELKKCWEYLNDIDDNGNQAHCGGQLNSDQIQHVHYAMNEIASVYSDFRGTLDDEETLVVVNDDSFNIGNSVCEDYSEQYDDIRNYTYWTTCADINYYWYEDYDFLTHDLDEVYKVEVED